MKIEKVDLRTLRNDEHFQLHTELRSLVEKHGAAALAQRSGRGKVVESRQ